MRGDLRFGCSLMPGEPGSGRESAPQRQVKCSEDACAARLRGISGRHNHTTGSVVSTPEIRSCPSPFDCSLQKCGSVLQQAGDPREGDERTSRSSLVVPREEPTIANTDWSLRDIRM